jgi:signal transduction histidine kinase
MLRTMPSHPPAGGPNAAEEIAALRDEVARLTRREQRQRELWQHTLDLAARVRQLDPAGLPDEAVALIGAGFAAQRGYLRVVPEPDAEPRIACWAVDGQPPASAHLLAAMEGEATRVGREPLIGDGPYRTLTMPIDGGALVLVRGLPGAPWEPAEVALVWQLAQEVGRALAHRHELDRERQRVIKLRELDRAKDEFLSTVSHELRTPLTNISGYVDTLLDGDAGPLPRLQRKMLGIVQRNSTRLRSLIEDLLTLSKVESGAFRFVRESVDLRELAREAMADVEAAAAKAEVRLTCRLGTPAPVVEGDRGQLYRAIANLLSNAIKFTPAGGLIIVGANPVGGSVVLTVTDTGIGIPAGELEQLFTRFFRGSNASAREIQGSGLGLAIVRMIARHHGGELEIESVENEGTTVRLVLPAGSEGAPAVPADGPPMVDSIDLLAGPVTGTVELPADLARRPGWTFDLTDPGYLRWMYETVLAEATTVAHLTDWLDGATLVDVWPELYLPPRVRDEWERRHPALRLAAGFAGTHPAGTAHETPDG